MRPLRTQAPTSFQKKWPRARRQKELKGIPDTHTIVFVYPLDMSPGEVGSAARRDASQIFKEGRMSHRWDRNVELNRHEVTVTQTKEQRRQPT